MTPTMLTAALVVLVGARLRPTSPVRRPAAADRPSSTTGSALSTRAASPRLLIRATRRATFDPAEVASWCDQLVRAVRSGSTLPAAIRDNEPPTGCSDEIGQIVLSLGRGASLGSALAVDTHNSHLAFALTVLRACSESGGPAAEPLDRVAATLRGRAADLAERQTFSAQARLSARVMTLLPIAMLVVLVITSGSTRSSMTTPFGIAIVAIGLALNLLGWRWMRRLIDGGTR